MMSQRALQNRRPIGVFDSGIGGLTVVKELIKSLPYEDIVYFGDTARVPYGTKSHQTVVRFSTENVLFLLRYNVKLIIVACNSSSSVALASLKRNFKVPIIGVIEPGAAYATSMSYSQRIGVIGTSTTIKSKAYEKQIRGLVPKAKVYSKSCPLFVPLAEEGWLDGKVTSQIIRTYLSPLKKKDIDTLILGCTHYPLLEKAIKRVMGKGVKLIDSAVSVAETAKALLQEEGLARHAGIRGRRRFFVSDEPGRFKRMGERFLGRRLSCVRKIGNGA